MMAEGMINRISAVLSPHLGPGSSNGDQIVRVMLAAMRVPTDAMLTAALRYNVLSDADRAWPAMIDEALSEKQP